MPADDLKAVPFKQLAQIGERRFADVPSKHRVTVVVPFMQCGETAAAKDGIDPLPQVHSVGSGDDEEAARLKDSNDFFEEPSGRVVPMLETVKTSHDIDARIGQRQCALEEILADNVQAERLLEYFQRREFFRRPSEFDAAAS